MSQEKEVNSYLGKKLKEARGLKGMSQTEIADLFGVTFQQIQKYEVGKNRISAAKLYLLAQHLGISLAWFFESSVVEFEVLDMQFNRIVSNIKNDKLRSKFMSLGRELTEVANA